MNQLTTDRRVRAIHCLVEGNSIRATCRLTDTAKNTVVDDNDLQGEARWS